MPTHSTAFSIETAGFTDIHDITSRASRFVSSSGVHDGMLVVFVPGSTAGVTTIEYEDGALEDLKNAIARVAPEGLHYAHDARWGDGNGFAHVRAAMLGPSLTIPVLHGRLGLGTWQQIILVDFDNRPRERNVILQVVGE
jgi:secondary thiamine-phosphate synthase enzyme